MNKEIICVFQDCPLCGDKGRKLKKLIFEKNLNVRKVSFASDEGRDLCIKAIQKRICKMPFYTDGERFTNNINELLTEEKVKKKTIKRTRKTTRKKVEDGTDS